MDQPRAGIILIWTLFILHTTLAGLPLQQKWPSPGSLLNDCDVSCADAKRRLVCGSDGKTYSSRCEVQKLDKCDGRNLKVAYKGRCKTKTDQQASGSKCLQERDQAILSKKPAYIPACRPDGTYADVQCHTGYCWCVTEKGKPVPGTSVQHSDPSCGRGKNGKPNKRRSGNKKGRKGCGPIDRDTFNTNLIRLFKEEFKRTPGSKDTNDQSGGLGIKGDSEIMYTEKRVIEWKFTTLDKNKDEKLKSKETRSLKRLVKKLVKPKACARNFIKHCDEDKNDEINKREWSICLGVDSNISFRLFLLLNHIDDRQGSVANLPKESRGDDQGLPSRGLGPSLSSKQTLPLSALRPRVIVPATEKPAKREQKKEKNCETDRKTAMQNDKDSPDAGIFIPRCSPMNAAIYEKAQCHTSTGYCWCVDEVSGKPIPGTSTHQVQPKCDLPPEREIKGCPIQNKRRYLMDLMDQLSTEMVEYATNNSDNRLPEPDPEHSLEERAVRWKFNMLDKNKNGNLERKELKVLKKDLKKKKPKSLRKCGRNFIRYCDADKNKKITVEEWIECTGVNDEKTKKLPTNPRRRGPNPFINKLT
ncbi:unnamed protein product [Owenia fusiformis]|uniref:Uncharacterized protein n=1 Tax=Owenia fusiformis TaxID=6347 RepID=A0A8J1U2J4_OWEFU|nr:unnamed protein product [Owenia fusiformis]